MKAGILIAAMNDLFDISEIGKPYWEWAKEMEGGLLVDAGREEETLLLHAEAEERNRIFAQARHEKWLDAFDANNLVFVFGRKLPNVLLHAMREGDTWKLRMAYCAPDGFAFCPAAGRLPVNLTGMDIEPRALGGSLDKASQETAFYLMDYALTGFYRLRGFNGKKRHHRTEMIDFLKYAEAA